MHRPSRFCTAVVCAVAMFSVFGLPHRVFAQSFELIGLRAQGMGGAFTAVADDATATWWNPAGLAAGPYFNALFEYDRAEHPSENRAAGFALALPSLGLSYYRIPIQWIRPVSSTAQPAVNRQDPGVFSQFGATVGQSLGNHLVVGSTLKLLNAAGDTHAGLDIGAMGTYNALRAGITVRNVARPSFGSGADAFEAARLVRAGIALVGRGRGGVDQAAIAVDADLTTVPTPGGDERHVALGGELWVLRRRVGVRGGISGNTVGDTRTSASAGVSLALRSGTYLDGVFTGGSDPMRNGWGAGVRVTF